MSNVIDVKPKIGIVKENKPKIMVLDIKPSLSIIGKEQTTYTDHVMAYKGQTMGLLLALTYPVDTVLGETARL